MCYNKLYRYDTITYNNTAYIILKELGIGYRKIAFLGENCLTGDYVIIFYPSITINYNNIEISKEKFIQDITELQECYTNYKNKCKLIPIYTSVSEYVIITEYIQGGIFYKYLCQT